MIRSEDLSLFFTICNILTAISLTKMPTSQDLVIFVDNHDNDNKDNGDRQTDPSLPPAHVHRVITWSSTDYRKFGNFCCKNIFVVNGGYKNY